MVEYICPRCGYTTDRKTSLISHFNRKKICTPNLNNIVLTEDIKNKSIMTNNKNSSLICQYCNNPFSRLDNLKTHERKCSEKPETDAEKESVKALRDLVEALNEQNKQLNDKIELLVKKAGITNYNTTNISNTMNVVILPHNQTDVSHLTDKHYFRSLGRCVNAIPHLIGQTHFNPKKPENHNIYISNISKGYAMVWNGKKWVVKNQNGVIDDLIRENEFRLEDWIESGGSQYPKAMEKFKLYVSKRDERGVPEMVRKEVRMMLYNNREMVEESNGSKPKSYHESDQITDITEVI